jgi:3',5'-nucleoside bisphosphate phosphatase
MSFLADLHVHTTYSDGQHSMAEIVDLYGLQGFGAIAITDHICEEKNWYGRTALRLKLSLTPATFAAYINELRSEAERAWRVYRMILIPGFELSKNSIFNHRSAHILGLGIDQFVSADLSALDMIRAIRGQGGVSVAAHPVWTRRFEKQTYYLWDNRECLRDEFDAWEVASGPHLFPEVRESGLPVVASGDVHHRRQMTSWKTEFHCERHEGAILEAIRKQELNIKFYRETLTNEYMSLLRAIAQPKPDNLVTVS